MAQFVFLQFVPPVLHEEMAVQTCMYVQAEKGWSRAEALHVWLFWCFSMVCVSFLGAGDGMVKFWDMRKTDKPSWQLSAPSPGAAQPVLTPTPKIRSKVAHAQPTFTFPSQAGNVYSMHMHGSLLAEQL